MTEKEIGVVIKERRAFMQMTQEDLAEIACIAVRTLRSIEQGQANPRLGSLLNLCSVLGLKVSVKVEI